MSGGRPPPAERLTGQPWPKGPPQSSTTPRTLSWELSKKTLSYLFAKITLENRKKTLTNGVLEYKKSRLPNHDQERRQARAGPKVLRSLVLQPGSDHTSQR